MSITFRLEGVEEVLVEGACFCTQQSKAFSLVAQRREALEEPEVRLALVAAAWRNCPVCDGTGRDLLPEPGGFDVNVAWVRGALLLTAIGILNARTEAGRIEPARLPATIRAAMRLRNSRRARRPLLRSACHLERGGRARVFDPGVDHEYLEDLAARWLRLAREAQRQGVAIVWEG